MTSHGFIRKSVPDFDRDFFGSGRALTRIGSGEIGGKAQGLLAIHDALAEHFTPGAVPDMEVSIPVLAVLGTDVFDAFMKGNNLYDIALSDAPDDRIAHAFQRADLPITVLGDLKALVDQVHTPLALRSSSLLEDALFRPFAGVYATKMTPNNQPDAAERSRRLHEAIKFVYASTFFRAAKSYIRATNHDIQAEKMAVIIQEVVGQRFGDRFYPDLSGVARSFNFYPSGRCKPEEGVVNLALGLGMTIVDGGISWMYSPAYPRVPPPFGSTSDLLRNTQRIYWAINMGPPPDYDPLAEREYLVECNLDDAEYDGTLRFLASTYNAASDRLSPGVGNAGPRALNFAPLLVLREYPLNDVINQILKIGEEALGADVEIEFAVTFPNRKDCKPARLGFLQVRPMVVSSEHVEIKDEEMQGDDVLVASDRVMGNGETDCIQDVVYVKPEAFDVRHTRQMADQVEKINLPLLTEGRPYLLIGFGRWGSSDPWLGIPVEWGNICGAKVIVETTLPSIMVDPSQGSHFFHNITSFEVSYFSVPHGSRFSVDWEWLAGQQSVGETEFWRHVRLEQPLKVKVDGRSGRGLIVHDESK